MNRPAVPSKYQRMSAEELAAATAEFDQEMVISRSRALTSGERRAWQEARRKPGRPRRGAGVKVISVSVERGLLSKSDALASRLGISRAALIERGLRLVLAGRFAGSVRGARGRPTGDQAEAVPGLAMAEKQETKPRFAVCVRNEGYEASLERNKLYVLLADADAEREGDVRVVDESGEDYLYPADWFVALEVPKAVRDSLLKAS